MTDGFKTIKRGEDTREFLGQIIAFRTDNFMFAETRKTWTPDGATYFALLSRTMDPWTQSAERGPNMSTVLLPSGGHSNHAVVAEMIGEQTLEMRLATNAEVQAIALAVHEGRAVCEYKWNENLRPLPAVATKAATAAPVHATPEP